jgi:hypothetical protein
MKKTCPLIVLCGLAGFLSHALAGETAMLPPGIDSEPLPVAQEPSASPSFRVNRQLSEEGPNPSVKLRSGEGSISPEANRLHYGLRLQVRGVYDDNINLSHFDRVSDYYFAIEPAITIGYGDIVERQGNYIRLDYAPSIFLFVDHPDDNAVQHLIYLEGYYRFGRLAVTLSQDVKLLEGANLDTSTSGLGGGSIVDVAGRTRLNLYTTRLNASYDLTGKTFLSGGLDYSVWDYENNLISSEFLSGNIFINYKYSPKLVVGLGGSGGYNWVDSPNPDQTFEQFNLRMSYQVTGKISLNASAGVEFRQFRNDARGDYVSPVYELGAVYQPFDGTTITLTGSGRTLNSAVLAGQDFSATNIIIGARQRLLQRIYLDLMAGYEHSEYFNTSEGVNATRRDNYYFVEFGVDLMITRWWTMGIYYLHRENDSSLNNFSFYDNQFGVRTAFTF